MSLRITSTSNPRIKAAARLRDRRGRDQQERIIIDGIREIGRALAAGVEVVELYFFPELCQDEPHEAVLRAARGQDADLVEVTPQVMEKLAYGQRVEGVVAIARPPERKLADLSLAPDALVAVVEGIEKPGNLGAIMRTADATGVAALLVAEGVTDLFNPNAIRASLGAIFTVPVVSTTNEAALDWLRSRKFRLYAARVDGAVPYSQADFRGHAAIILGSEASGLSAAWQAADVTTVHLPMHGTVDSLNLSATAAVLLYEALRQRSGKG